MNYSIALEHFSRNIQILEESIRQQIRRLPDGELRWWHQRKKNQDYLVYLQDTDEMKNNFITKDNDLCFKLAMKYCLERQLEYMENFIAALRIAEIEAGEMSTDSILKRLPKEVSALLLANAANVPLLNVEATQKQEDLEWRQKEYMKSDFFSQYLTHRTSTGEFVRSKSEVIIYEKLLEYDIAFRYECHKYMAGYDLHPDFTIRRKDGKIFYWEHCGLMNKQDYVDSYHWRMDKYEKEGIVLWDNLIVTFDDPFGNIDVNIIESEINNKLLCY